MIKKLEQNIDLFEKIFLYLFFIYAVLGSNNITYGKPIISFVMWPTLVLGFLLVLYRVIKFKDYLKQPGLYYLIALLVSLCVSVFVNYNYNLKGNLVFCVYWALYFFVIYLMNTSKDIILAFCRVFVGYASLTALTSIIMMFTGYSSSATAADTGYFYYSGFSKGRLWGVFINPNNGAITAAIAIMMLIYFTYISKVKWQKIALIIDALLLLLFIAFTDSRSGALCLGVVLAVFVFVFEWQKQIGIKKLGIVVLSMILLVVGFYVPRATKNLYNYCVPKISSFCSTIFGEESSSEVETLKIERNYDMSGDVSNRRFDAWKSAIEVYASSAKMIAFGASYKGFTDYARENLPSTYIVNNDYTDFTTLDNELFNIMDAQGTFGLIAFLALVVFVLVFIIKHAFKTKDPAFIALLVAILFGLAGSACVCSVMFYHFSPNGILFWVILGGLVSILGEEEKSWELT